MKERAAPSTSLAERKEEERQLVRRIAVLAPQERLQIWKRETGKSQAALYRRLAEASR
jgi:hypothetical protein